MTGQPAIVPRRADSLSNIQNQILEVDELAFPVLPFGNAGLLRNHGFHMNGRDVNGRCANRFRNQLLRCRFIAVCQRVLDRSKGQLRTAILALLLGALLRFPTQPFFLAAPDSILFL